jgi:hypothetical protein
MKKGVDEQGLGSLRAALHGNASHLLRGRLNGQARGFFRLKTVGKSASADTSAESRKKGVDGKIGGCISRLSVEGMATFWTPKRGLAPAV